MRGKRRIVIPGRWIAGAYAALIFLMLSLLFFCFWLILNRKTKVKVLLTGSADMVEGFTIFSNESNTKNFN